MLHFKMKCNTLFWGEKNSNLYIKKIVLQINIGDLD